jgi:hypothetical protein
MDKNRSKLVVIVGFIILAIGLVFTSSYNGQAQQIESETVVPVGLSLFFRNGQMAPITLIGDVPRYIQEVDIVATVNSTTDEGIEPLIRNSEFSSLNWSGVTMVDEDWRPAGDGTFIRQRFYRGAKWMENPSQFFVFPTGSDDNPIGEPLFALAGADGNVEPADDGFVRRFVARQIASGCPSVGDCSGATFIAQGLVQLRDALQADMRARKIPANATRLALKWTEDNQTPRSVEISHASASDFPFGYGFQISLKEISAPANGSFYVAGENVSFRVTFSDGQGSRLHPEGSLPTYGQFLRGEIESGLRYYDTSLSTTTYYALKHRESNLLVTLSGPIDKLRTPRSVVGIEKFFLPVIPVTSVAVDGFTDLATGVPPFPVILGGLFDPAVWDTPVSDIVTFTIPSDALAGTYISAIKARREFGGEALNRATTADIQVGTAAPTTFTPKTGRCNTCHSGPSSFENILHGATDRRSCYSCHASLFVEPDAALDIRVHMVHDRSNRFQADINNCAVCHLTPPDGPARGLLNR